MVKVILTLLCALSFAGIRAAEYIDGQLYVEVLLATGSDLDIEAAGRAPLSIQVSEKDSPIQATFEGNLHLQIKNSGRLVYWGVEERSEPWNDQPDGIMRQTFAWEDSTLIIKRDNVVYAEESFPDQASAEAYASAFGYPTNTVRSIPLVNSTVCITSTNGDEQYFETPVRFHADEPVYIGGVRLEFNGDFVVKTVNDRLVVNHFLPLEEYVAGVVPNEIGSEAPLEALKAQAVAARTHAVSLLLYNRHSLDGYDLCNSTHCQVYKGTYLQNGDVLDAVSETAGEILLTAGRVADATYHSSCGGKTDSSANIWNGLPAPYLMGVDCVEGVGIFDLTREYEARQWIDTAVSTQGMTSWERNANYWQARISRQSLAKNIGMTYLNRITINKRGNSGRITDMSFYGSGTVRLTSEYKIRQAFGGLRSSFFYIRQTYTVDTSGHVTIYPQDMLVMIGKGSGHGVGMCQVGTLQRARRGDDYRDILEHYYPGTWISTNWIANGKN